MSEQLNTTARELGRNRLELAHNAASREDWEKVWMVLDEWSTEGQLDPRLEQLRQLVGMKVS